MVCCPFKADRAVEIVAPKYGSGYRIGGRLVLTAAHLFPQGIGSEGKVRSKETFGTVNAEVVWTAPGADIALVELPDEVLPCECVTFGALPTGSGKIQFDLYGWPRWAQTTRSDEKPQAGGRQIDGLIYLADTSPQGFLVLEPTRVPEAAGSNEGGSDWQGISGAAVVCEGLVVAVQRQHQNPLRPASLEAEPLVKVHKDEDWRRLLEKEGITPEFTRLQGTDQAIHGHTFIPDNSVPRVVPDYSTFRDHCVIEPKWLADAVNQVENPLPFVWHPKIQRALKLVEDNARAIDQNAYRLLLANKGDAAAEIASYKEEFFTHQTSLDKVLRKTERAYIDLCGHLRNVEPDLRDRALHTYAAASSLELIKILQRLEGYLFTDTERRVVRLFPDLPKLYGPLVGLPYRHPVNELAYGSEGCHGFIKCRICSKSESKYEYVYLSLPYAETHQDEFPGPVYLYYGWVIPQWLILYNDPPPGEREWWITVLKEDKGVEQRYTKHCKSPWSGSKASDLALPQQYQWSEELFEHCEIAPGMWCWVVR